MTQMYADEKTGMFTTEDTEEKNTADESGVALFIH